MDKDVVEIGDTIEIEIDGEITETLILEDAKMLSHLLAGKKIGATEHMDLGLGAPHQVKILRILK